MNSKILIDNLDLLSNEISTIQHLKTLIIDLAVTGRFSRGMFESELGSEVIRKSIEKSNSKTIKSLDESLSYCDVPNHWSWSNTEILCHTQTGATPDKSGSIDENSITYITSADIQGFRAHSENKVSRLVEGKKLRIAPAGSILFVGIGDVGRCGVTEIESTFNQQIHSATPYVTDPKFLCLFYSSTFFRNQIKLLSSATTLTILNKSKWSSIPVPVPSLMEQQWIVEKAEELLGIFDELEAKLNFRKLVETASRNSVVDAVSRAQSPEELRIAWKRIEDNWEVIVGDLEAINSVRKLILSLAAKGKLVENPDRFSNETTYFELNEVCQVSWGNLALTKSSYTDDGEFLAVSAAGPDGRIGIAEYKAYTPVLSAIGARCGTLFMPSEDFTAIKNTMTLQPNSNLLDNWYLFYSLRGSELPRRGSAQPFMSKSDIEKFKIRVPSLDEQKLIASTVESLLEKCDLLESKLREADQLTEKFARSVIAASA
jgi:restriction endonuclease S subunit